jgi:hypothetical protein
MFYELQKAVIASRDQSASPRERIRGLIDLISPRVFVSACEESGLINFFAHESPQEHIHLMTECVVEAVWAKICKEAHLRQ